LTDSGLRVKTRKEAHMKTQLSKPARSKARYSDQYKQEALELWLRRSRGRVTDQTKGRFKLDKRRSQQNDNVTVIGVARGDTPLVMCNGRFDD